MFQRDATRQVDPTRPAGYWECDGRLGWPMHYRVAAVACNCEHHYPLCADGTPDDCNGNTCAPGQSCVNFNNYCGCVGQCNSDADCGPGQACLCAGSLSYTNRCIPADCLDDDDCSGDLRCKVSQDICYQPVALRCTTPADDCARHSDCMTNYCRWDEVEELWTCDQPAICE